MQISETVKEALTEGALITGTRHRKTITINTIIKILEKEGRSIMLLELLPAGGKKDDRSHRHGSTDNHRMLGINFIIATATQSLKRMKMIR